VKRAVRVLLVAVLGTTTLQALHAQTVSFVTCPIVRDTKTAPCWLAEYNGETYYLGKQGGVAQDFYPPQLNHEVLVEGVVAEGPRICGGVPLKPVKTSVFLEINRACNTILPAEDGFEAPEGAPSRDPVSWVRAEGPLDVTLFFDFDNDFLSLHGTTAIQRIAEQFQQNKAAVIELRAFRGSSRLSSGTVLVENPRIAEARAGKVREILEGLGLPRSSVSVVVVNDVKAPNGVDDAWSRKVTLSVKK
jgi:hypothetical protein